MLRRFTAIKNFALAASDGIAGKVRDLYFDDHSWTVRYVGVDTGGWLTGRQVLLAPPSFEKIDEAAELIGVQLTKKQIEDIPSIDADNPVSRQHEEDWHHYHGHPAYWLVPDAIVTGGPVPVATPERGSSAPSESRGDPHLRSTGEVIGYSIHASDGDIGHVDDFIFDDEQWAIRYLVISRSWWRGKKVILSPEWIERVGWEDNQVFVPLTAETIKAAPAWDEAQPITRTFEADLFDYYRRGRY